ncbi:hypothetical protein [Streptomyces sp. NBC_01571]|uniref:hypothetical protein n=1 Tax=Streptomyces sp. NBC_01571 TaxID=2975883 RepID=UPI00338F37B9
MSERAGVDETVARRGVAAVFMTLGEAVPATEFQDVMPQPRTSSRLSSVGHHGAPNTDARTP